MPDWIRARASEIRLAEKQKKEDREREVNAAIRQLQITRVIVAHRPETIASVGRVIVLQDGRVAQDLRSVPSAGAHTR